MNVLTMPVEYFEAVVQTLLSGKTNAGVKMQDEVNQWWIGIATDNQSGAEFIQITQEPLLVVAK